MSHAFEIIRRDATLRLAGELRIADAGSVWRTLRGLARDARDERLDLDLSDASVVDGAVMSLLVEIRAELEARGVTSSIVGASEQMRPLVHLYHGDEPPPAPTPETRSGVLERLGRAIAGVSARFMRLSEFVGELAAATAGTLRRPATSNLRQTAALAERAGIDGVPIVLVLNFLVGFVMAFQSTNQLRGYGANVYVADVVGIALTRELVPLMIAIIMAGRSGASFAAEIGAMKVSEEIDALRTIGLAPVRWLVLPRVLALALVAPVLTLLGDVIGIAGGAVVGSVSLGVSLAGYLAELQTAVFPKDVWSGLIKSVAFAIAIALIGCQQGFATAGGAVGVGRRTTSTVVMCLFTVVILDTVITLFFRIFHI